MRSAREKNPISTRAASTVMPIFMAPAAMRAGLIWPAGLMEATSKAGVGGWGLGVGDWAKTTVVRRRTGANFGMFNINLFGFGGWVGIKVKMRNETTMTAAPVMVA